jgi:hypothetical protein
MTAARTKMTAEVDAIIFSVCFCLFALGLIVIVVGLRLVLKIDVGTLDGFLLM